MPSIGYHDVTINSHYWGTTSKGNVQLCVGVTFADGDSMTGYIYFTPATCRSNGERDDGTPKRSMAERALNAVGYFGKPNNAQRQIADDDLVDTTTRARVVKQDEQYGGGVKINGFYETVQRADPTEVNTKLDALFDPDNAPDDGWDDTSEPPPAEEPAAPPASDVDPPCPKCGAVDAKKPMDHKDTCPEYAPF